MRSRHPLPSRYPGEGCQKEVAVGTGSRSTQQSNDDRHQRWERLERAELRGRDGALQAQGLSQRHAAKVLAGPRSTRHAWRADQERLDACPAVVTVLHRVPGLTFVHRLVLAIHLGCTEVGAGGRRLGGLLLELTGLKRFVGTS